MLQVSVLCSCRQSSLNHLISKRKQKLVKTHRQFYQVVPHVVRKGNRFVHPIILDSLHLSDTNDV